MISVSPGRVSLNRQSFCISTVTLIFCSIGGNLVYHNPSPNPKTDYLETQNNFTTAQITENDGYPVGAFVYAYPISIEDRRAGRICSKTGWWAPGRFIVYVDGRPFIREFARESIQARYNRKYIPHYHGGA